MTEFVTKAPGKLMIAGEYAVLFGHAALTAAVDRDAICSYVPGDGWQFFTRVGQDFIRQNDHPLLVAALRASDFFGHKTRPGTYSVDTSAFFDSDSSQKLGLGSSAAATVALCKMILAQEGIDDRHLLLNLALKAHGDFSEGFGSGADVAVCVFGGAITYQKTKDSPLIKSANLRCAWPNFIFIDTKRSQNTRDFVKQVLKSAEQQSNFVTDFCRHSARLCDELFHVVDDVNRLITIMDALYHLLNALGQRAGVDIISVPHTRIHDLARTHGGTAKPSGAGGGDISLAIVPEHNRRAFLRELMDLGFSALPLNIHSQCSP